MEHLKSTAAYKTHMKLFQKESRRLVEETLGH